MRSAACLLNPLSEFASQMGLLLPNMVFTYFFSLPITSLRQDHCRFTWVFESLTLHYYDTRCLSKLYFYPNKITCQIPLVADLPHDISSLQFLDYQTFFLLYGKRKISIKQWLLDQTTCPSGLGNYLACEVLARAKLFPFMSVSTISRDCYQNLLLALLEVHQLASSTAAYSWFLVFNREHCAICQSVIIKKKIPKYAQTTQRLYQCLVRNYLINKKKIIKEKY